MKLATSFIVAVTGYELASGHLHPLDNTSTFAGAAYENAEEQAFIDELPEAIGIAFATPYEVYPRFICGQFVDRILSTQPIANGKEWERM